MPVEYFVATPIYSLGWPVGVVATQLAPDNETIFGDVTLFIVDDRYRLVKAKRATPLVPFDHEAVDPLNNPRLTADEYAKMLKEDLLHLIHRQQEKQFEKNRIELVMKPVELKPSDLESMYRLWLKRVCRDFLRTMKETTRITDLRNDLRKVVNFPGEIYR